MCAELMTITKFDIYYTVGHNETALQKDLFFKKLPFSGETAQLYK
jgi:hypothetical protein